MAYTALMTSRVARLSERMRPSLQPEAGIDRGEARPRAGRPGRPPARAREPDDTITPAPADRGPQPHRGLAPSRGHVHRGKEDVHQRRVLGLVLPADTRVARELAEAEPLAGDERVRAVDVIDLVERPRRARRPGADRRRELLVAHDEQHVRGPSASPRTAMRSSSTRRSVVVGATVVRGHSRSTVGGRVRSGGHDREAGARDGRDGVRRRAHGAAARARRLDGRRAGPEPGSALPTA